MPRWIHPAALLPSAAATSATVSWTAALVNRASLPRDRRAWAVMLGAGVMDAAKAGVKCARRAVLPGAKTAVKGGASAALAALKRLRGR